MRRFFIPLFLLLGSLIIAVPLTAEDSARLTPSSTYTPSTPSPEGTLPATPTALPSPVRLGGPTATLIPSASALPSPVQPILASPSWTPTPYGYDRTPIPSPTWVPSPTWTRIPEMPISIGEEIEAEMPPGQFEIRYRFAGEAGDAILARLVTPENMAGRTHLTLIDLTEGRVRNDWSAPTENVTQLIAILPRTGDFDLLVQDAYGTRHRESLPYALAISRLEPETVAIGESVEGVLTPGKPADIYAFEGEAGERIAITLKPETFAPFLSLTQDPPVEWLWLLQSSSPTTGIAAQIGPYRLPESGRYLVLARSLGAKPQGSYTLSIERIEPAAITYGASVEGEIAAGEGAAYYAFEGRYGDIIDASVYADGDAILYLHLDSARGSASMGEIVADPQRVLVYDDDSGRGDEPEISRYLLPEDGIYLLRVAAYVPGKALSYTLNLDLNAYAKLDEGPVQVPLSKPGVPALPFDVEAGEKVRLIVESVEGANLPGMWVEHRGMMLVNFPSSSLDRLAVDFVAQADGRHLVILSRESAAGGVVEVTLERD